jgi:hypothetical protein
MSLGGAIPFVGGILESFLGPMEDDAAQADARAVADELRYLDSPEFSSKQLSPESFSPEMYANPEEAQYKLAEVDPRIRDYQMQALQRMRDLSDGHASAQQNLANYEAMNRAGQMAKARDAALMQNAQSRGVAGSGLEFAMRQQAGQEAANRAQSGTMQAAMNAALERLKGNESYQRGMADFRGQEMDQSARNADIINRFNQYNTGQRNAIRQANVGMRNAAQQTNIGNRNTAQQYNLERGDRNAMNRFGTRLEALRAASGAHGNLAGQKLNSLQGNRDRDKESRNDLEQMMGGGIMGGA